MWEKGKPFVAERSPGDIGDKLFEALSVLGIDGSGRVEAEAIHGEA